MPEGDTIRRLADRLTEKFAGESVASSLFRHPRLATVDLNGTELLTADARGKHLLMRFSNGFTLHVHLRMTGSVYSRFAAEVSSHRRKFEIQFSNGWVTGVNTPIVELMRTRDEPHVLGYLGPDVCGGYDHAEGVRRLQGAGPVPISQALLDQRIVAGFGNIYAVETPFIVGIHPYTPTDRLSGLNELLSVAVGLIRTNDRFGPQNTTGHDLRLTRHWVLGSKTFRCKFCGEKVERRPGADTPWQRRTAWCVACQPRDATLVNLTRAARLLQLHPCRRIVNLREGKLTVDVSSPVRTESRRVNEGRRENMT